MELPAEYGISRTPLREALKVLAAEGLVTMKVRRGAYVTEVSDTDLAESTTCSRCWKAMPPAWSRPATAAQLAELQSLHDELEAPAATTASGSSRQRALSHAAAGDRRQPLARQMVADLRKVMKLNPTTRCSRPGASRSRWREHCDPTAGPRARCSGRRRGHGGTHFADGLAAGGLTGCALRGERPSTGRTRRRQGSPSAGKKQGAAGWGSHRARLRGLVAHTHAAHVAP